MHWELLSPLAPADRERVLRATLPRRYGRHEVVFHEDDPGASMHLVRAGRLAVRVSNRAGDCVTLNVLSPGDAFGELALVRPQHRRTASVIALEKAETLLLDGAAFHELCRRHPSIEQLVLTLLAERVDQLSQRLLEALYVGVDRRVYRRLTELTQVYGNGEQGTAIPLTQDDFSDLVGASRPTVNRVLRKLSARGSVELERGRMIVHDPLVLHRLAATG